MIARLRHVAESFGARPAWLRWGAVALWIATIWWLSSRPPRPGHPSTLTVFVLNGGHVVLFGTLAALAHLAQRPRGSRRFVTAVLIAACYGVVDELHQSYVPGRDSSVWDWCTDVSGAVFAAGVATWVRDALSWARTAAIVAVPAACAAVSGATFL